MGIYDREYYRYPSGGLGWGGRTTDVVKWLLLANIAVFLLQLLTDRPGGGSGRVTEFLATDLDAVARGEVWRVLTGAFAHGGIWHIAVNMFFLWMFGRALEGLYGSKEFLAFYLVSAVVAGGAWLLWTWAAGAHGSMVGASGAVMAVMVLYAVRFPRSVIYIWFVLPVPVWVLVALKVLLDLFAMRAETGSNVAYAAHLGGAAFGALYAFAGFRLTGFLRGGRWPRLRLRRRPRVRVLVPDDEEPTIARDEDRELERTVDRLLAKIHREGQDSLTAEERRILERASRRYQSRRR